MKPRRHKRAARLELQIGSMMAEGCCAVWSLLTTHYLTHYKLARLGVTCDPKRWLVCLEKAFSRGPGGGEKVNPGKGLLCQPPDFRFCAFPAISYFNY